MSNHKQPVLTRLAKKSRAALSGIRSTRQYAKGFRGSGSLRVIAAGTPVYGNYGDSAILLAQVFFLREYLPSSCQVTEITWPEYYAHRKQLRRLIRRSVPIVCMGGGNMGNQWVREEQLRYDVISDFPRNPVVVFPQTIYFSEKGDPAYTPQRAMAAYNGRIGLTVAARESESYSMMKELFPDTEVLIVPDIVLWADMEKFGAVPQKRSGIRICARHDAEQAVPPNIWERLEQSAAACGRTVSRIEMDIDGAITKENRRECVREKMQEYCGAELVITDRLHGMVFAALTGTPCIVFGNYNHKVRGTYEWIRHLPYIRYAESAEEAEAFLPELLAMKDCRYDNTPLLPYFEKLKEVVKQTCQS